MKKIFIIIIAVVVVVVCGMLGFNAYYSGIDAANVPVTPVEIAGEEVLPISAAVEVSVIGDLLYKPLECKLNAEGWQVVPKGAYTDIEETEDTADTAMNLGQLGDAPFYLIVNLPDTMQWTVKLASKDDSDGEIEIDLADEDIVLHKADEYALTLTGSLEKGENGGPSGEFFYKAAFSVKNPDPVFSVGDTDLAQGDVFSLKLENLEDGIEPTLETALGPAIFTKGVPGKEDGDKELISADGFTNWYAAVPISNSRSPGLYTVLVTAGELSYETTVTVVEYEFDYQDMVIDTSTPSVAAAVTGEAIAQFREKVSPLIPLISEERYWNGRFEMPVDLGEYGFISTAFGEVRVTNGNQNTRRSHLGMDIAVSEGEPVNATGSGLVLLAEFLLNTGNTVIIDHGGGIKSFYYHMEAVETEEGTIVQRGDLIGRVGSTGYSTGPHLHFEMRIGEQPISPTFLFEPQAGLYSAIEKE